MTHFEELRYQETLSLPKGLQSIGEVHFDPIGATTAQGDVEELRKLFPHTFGQELLKGRVGTSFPSTPLKIGVVFSGGQASGGHNVVTGLFDALKTIHPQSQLFGFLNGPIGIIEGNYEELTEERLYPYRNTGGFDLIGSGRTKIQLPEQLHAALETVNNLGLHGLVIVGGDDSNTNAAILAEYFKEHQQETHVVGVPKTIDGDLKSEYVESSFGFDSACKTYSQIIGNICRDALSAKKYYHFIRLMGRSASHITLECALQTHPNKALILEEVGSKQRSFSEIIEELYQMVTHRFEQGKNYGVVLIPEGLLEFIPECNVLIQQLNLLLASEGELIGMIESFQRVEEKREYLKPHLSSDAFRCFSSFPEKIQEQLLNDRDPHGNVRVSQIETEQLLMTALKEKLKKENFQGSFTPLSHFLGYEGRACWPSSFDAHYCYALGYGAAALLMHGKTGYMACVRNLCEPVEEWELFALPLTMMMNLEVRHGDSKPVIKKALVDLKGPVFKAFERQRGEWVTEDLYAYPVPMQYFGSYEIKNAPTFTLQLEREFAYP